MTSKTLYDIEEELIEEGVKILEERLYMNKDELWKYWDSIFHTEKQLDDEIQREKWSMNTRDPFIRHNSRMRYKLLKEYRNYRLTHAKQLSFMDELGI